jgi:autotransporter-associated beta strand protein
MLRRSSPGVRTAILRAAFLAAFALFTPAARGDDYYWTGDNVANGNKWNALTGLGGTNWSLSPDFNNGSLGLPGASDNVFFYFNPPPNTGNLTNVLGQDFSVRSLNFTSDSGTTVTIGGTNTLTLGVGGLNILQNAGAHVLNTQVALGAAQTWTNNSASALTVNGVISGSNNLTVAGAAVNGGFTLNAANTYTGSTTLATAGASLILSGANGSILGTTAITLNAGSTLNLDNTAANNNNRIAATLGITSNGGTFNLLGNAGTPTAQTVGTLTLGSGLTNVSVTDGGAGATLTLGSVSIPSFARPGAGSAVNISLTGTSAAVAAPNVTLSNGIVGGWATVGSVNTGGTLSVIGGVVTYNSPNAATNALDFATVSGGTVAPLASYNTTTTAANWTAADNVKISGTIAPTTAGATVNSLYLTGNARLGVANTTAYTIAVGSGGIISNQATGSYIVGGNFTANQAAGIGGASYSGGNTATANGNLNAHLIAAPGVPDLVITTASNLQLNLVIGSSTNNAFGLTKNGSGILDIGGGNSDAIVNTFTGKVTVNGGILLVRSDNGGANGSNFGPNPATFTPDAITLNGGEIRTTAGFTFAANRGITVGTNGGTLSYNGGSTWTIAQKITGPGSITYAAVPSSQTGTNNTIVINSPAGTSNYAGSTTLIANQALNPAQIASQGTIQWGGNDQIPDLSALTVLSNTLGGTGTGVGRIDMNGKSDTIGSLAGNAPIINFNSATGLTTGGNNQSTTFSGSLAGTITNGTGGSYTIATAGTGTLTKIGTGTFTLSGPNNYTGATNIGNAGNDGGALMVTGTLLGTSQVNVGFGTTHSGTLGGSGTITSNVVVNQLGHLSPTPGANGTTTLTISGNLTVSGGATFDYNFGTAGSPGVSDFINVTNGGNVTLNAGTDILNLTALSGFGIGTYNLITASGTLTNNATFSVNGSNAFTYAVSASGNNLVLTVTPGNPTLTWIGNVNSNWVVGGPANWNNGSGAVAFATNNNVVFDDNSTNLTVAVDNGGVTANSVIVANTTGTYNFSGGPVTVTTNVTKSQAGSVTFNNNVSAVITTINGGTFAIGSTSSYTSTTKVDVNGSTLQLLGTLTTPALNINTGSTLTGTGTVTGNASVTGTGVINLTSPASITGTLSANGGSWLGTGTVGGLVTVGGGTFTIGSGANLIAPAGVSVTGGTIGGTATSTINGTVTDTAATNGGFPGIIAGAASGVTVNAPGTTFTASDLNTYGGPTTITAGTLSITKIVNGGAASGIGASPSAAANLVLDGGTLQYAGPAATTDRNFTITAGKTGTLDVTNTLTISGASASTTGALTKVGAGTLTLTGSNLHSGGTTVSVGTLLANNATGSATGTGAVTVAAGATLGGTGFVVPNTGSVTTNTVSIAGVVSPGSPSSAVGTLTLGSAANNATATVTGSYQFNLTGLGAANPASPGGSTATAVQDLLAVNGTLTLTGSTVNISAASSGFTGSSGYSWQLATATAGVTGTPALGTITGDFAPFSNGFSLSEDANNLYLNFVAPFTWVGNTSTAWATGSNWLPGTVPGSGKTAIFQNPSSNTTVSLGGAARAIGGLLFDTASAPAYTIGSTAGDALVFDANASISVTGTVTTPQTVAAAVQVLGALTVSNAGTGGLTLSGPLTLATGGTPGTLTFAGSGATTYSGNITAGSVSGVVVSGPGTVTLSGTNTFGGGVTLNGGTLNVNTPTALGTGPLALNGGTLNNTSAGAITSTTNIPVGLNASFAFGGTQNLNLGTGAVTQAADVTVTQNGANNLTFGGSVSGGMSMTLAGAGTGTLGFGGANNSFNNLTNSGPGVLSVGQPGGTTTVAGGLTNSGAGMVFLTGATTVTGSVSVTGGAITQPNPNTYQYTLAGGVLQLAPGASLTATGLTVGGAGAASTSGQVLLAAGSSLTVNSPGTVNIGFNTANTAAIGATVTASGNAAVSITASAIVLGGNQSTTGNRTNVTVTLGTGDNLLATTSATGITIGAAGAGGQDGDYSRSDNLGQAMLILGRGNNTLTTSNLIVSGQKAPGSVFLGNGPVDMTANGNATSPVTTSAYAPPVPFLKPNGTTFAQVTVSDVSGGKTTAVFGNQNTTAATGTNSIGVFDTTGGILNGTFATVTLGFNTFAPSSTHGGGVGSWVLGVANNSVTIDKVLMTNTVTATQGITGAVFSLNGGTVTFNTGGGGFAYGGTASFTNTNINLNGGLLDLNGNAVIDPASAPLPLDSFGFNGGTLRNATAVFVTGGVVQNGGILLRDQAGTTIIGTSATPGSDVYTAAGGATIKLDGTSGTAAVSAGSLARLNSGTLDIVPVTGQLDATELVQFTGTPPTPVAGEPILPAWIVARTNGTATASADFTVFNASPNQSIGRFTAYNTGNLNTASPTDIAAPAAATALTSSPTVYALKLSNAITDTGAHTLTIGAAGSPAGLILNGGSIAANSLVFADEAVIYTTAQNGTITSPVTAANGLTKFGPGTLTISNTVAVNATTGTGAVNLNAGTLVLNGTMTAAGPVAVRNGATLSGTGSVTLTGSNGVSFGPGSRFVPGNGASFGLFSITTGTGNVTTATATTNPVGLTSSQLTFGLGISPTNVVGSAFTLTLGTPLATGASNTGLSNANVLGSHASGFSVTSSGGTFVLDPITTVTVNANPANFAPGSSYSYLVGTVPTGSAGGVTNLGNFDFSNAGTSFLGSVNSASLLVSGGGVYLNFTTTPVPEPATTGLLTAAGLGVLGLVRRRKDRKTGV